MLNITCSDIVVTLKILSASIIYRYAQVEFEVRISKWNKNKHRHTIFGLEPVVLDLPT